jgi:hypothetical protein
MMELKGHELRGEDDLKGGMIIFQRKKGGLEGGISHKCIINLSIPY